MKRDIVLVINGGGMVSIFSMGVFKVFEENNLLDRIHSIYATSAGADNAAYFLAGQAHYGRKFYLEDLNNDEFLNINFLKFLKYVYQIIRFRILKNSKVDDLINLDYPVNVAKYSKRKLDFDKLDLDKIHFYVKVFSLKYYGHKYLRLNKDNLYEGLKATSNAVPLTKNFVKINNEDFLDGDSVKSDISVEVIKKHLNDKIIIRIDNFPIPRLNLFSFFFTLPRLFLASTLILILFGFRLYRKYIFNFYKYFNYSNKIPPEVVNIQNEMDASMICRDVEKLDAIFENGVKLGNECLYKLKLLDE